MKAHAALSEPMIENIQYCNMFEKIAFVLQGDQDVRRADPFASFIQRRGYKTSKVHSVANRNNTGKTKSNPRASVG